VIDAGVSHRSEAYFAFERLEGPAITDWCDRRQIGVFRRLELVLRVCDAIAFAHRRGFPHGALAPSKIRMVVKRNGVAVPKVEEIGIAAASWNDPDDAAASDVIGLGMLLHELLAGIPPPGVHLPRPPDGRRDAGARRRRPPRPSERIAAGGEDALRAAWLRRADPGFLAGLLVRELDWITMKALDPDPRRGYRSVAELAGDLEAYLLDEPVGARPPGLLDRLREALLPRDP
jgi:serine/threonine protein kinase